jgi:uncharacterized membrane-anchored protein YitT (DUF2179 family)
MVADMTTTILAGPVPLVTPLSAPAARHSRVDDMVGMVTGAFLASLGLFLVKSGGTVTGGTAGLGLLIGQVVPAPFGVIFLGLSLPFILLAGLRKGWHFAARSVTAVALLSAFSLIHPHAITVIHLGPFYAAVVGNLVVGVGILILFRHRSSLGGFNVVALICQERLGWRAGYVQLVLDAFVVALSSLVTPTATVLYSAVGAVILNLVLAMNHRPGRYLGT